MTEDSYDELEGLGFITCGVCEDRCPPGHMSDTCTADGDRVCMACEEDFPVLKLTA